MVKTVAHTKARVFEISKLKNLFLENPETIVRPLEVLIHPNLQHDTITVSNLVQKISYSCRDVANCGTILLIFSNECWIKAGWMNDKNDNVYKTKRKETIHTLFFTIINLKSAKTHKSRQILLSRKTVCSGISKLIFNFHIFVIYNVLYFPLWNSTLYFPCFPFFFIDRLFMFPFPFYWSHLKVDTSHSVNFPIQSVS